MNRHKNDDFPKKVKRFFDELPSQSEPRPLQGQERRNEFTLETPQRSRALLRPPVLEAGPLALLASLVDYRGDASIDLLQRVTGQSDKAMQGSVKSLEEKGVLELYVDEETGMEGAMITAKGVGVWGYFQIWEKAPDPRQ